MRVGRDPVTHTRLGVETIAALTPLGLVVAYFVGKLDPTMPEEIRQAVVGIVVGLGSIILSAWRNRKAA